MQVLSLFDGISCGRVALERIGVPVDRYVAYEIEPNAIKISRKNWPDIEHKGDVTVADFTQFEGIDLLMGGSPCQSLSIIQAHKRQNLNGKSKLFFEFVRAMKEAKPCYFLFENVASMNDESRRTISELLGCQPVFINSNSFVAQDRPRLYWTNIPIQAPPLKECAASLKDIMQPNVPEKYFYGFPLDGLDMSKKVCAHMVHNNLEMHRRVYNPDYKVGCLTAVCGGNQQRKVYDNGRARKLTPLEYERLQGLPDNYTTGICDGQRYKAIGNGWTVDVIAWILSFIPRKEEEECASKTRQTLRRCPGQLTQDQDLEEQAPPMV